MNIYIAVGSQNDFIALKQLLNESNQLSSIDVQIRWQSCVTYKLPDYLCTCDLAIIATHINQFDGLAYAKHIRASHQELPLVFYGEDGRYGVESYEVDAFYYLKKPLTLEMINNMLDKLEKIKTKGKRIQLKCQKNLISVSLDAIIYLTCENHQVIVRTRSHRYYVYDTLDAIMSSLNENFLRCHRGFIVNRKYIANMNSQRIILKNGEYIPVSKRRFRHLYETVMR